MATTPEQTINPGDGWVEVTSSDGVGGLTSNAGFSARYAESATTPASDFKGHPFAAGTGIYKQDETVKAYVKAGSGTAYITFSPAVTG